MKPRRHLHRPKRHHWALICSVEYKTERECTDCHLIKVTDHQDPNAAIPWIKWVHPAIGEVIGGATPQCPPRAENPST